MQAIQPGMTRAFRRCLFAGASGLAVALSLGVGAAAAQVAPSRFSAIYQGTRSRTF